jgi:hypothetical protein
MRTSLAPTAMPGWLRVRQARAAISGVVHPHPDLSLHSWVWLNGILQRYLVADWFDARTVTPGNLQRDSVVPLPYSFGSRTCCAVDTVL